MNILFTVNVDIFAQHIFLCISRRALGARKCDVSENYYHNRTNTMNLLSGRVCAKIDTYGLMGENLAARKYLRLQYCKL